MSNGEVAARGVNFVYTLKCCCRPNTFPTRPLSVQSRRVGLTPRPALSVPAVWRHRVHCSHGRPDVNPSLRESCQRVGTEQQRSTAIQRGLFNASLKRPCSISWTRILPSIAGSVRSIESSTRQAPLSSLLTQRTISSQCQSGKLASWARPKARLPPSQPLLFQLLLFWD